MNTYKYRDITVPGTTAEETYLELERIREDVGLTPQTIVDDARPETAVLHPAFEWQDTVAGEKWRKHQARNLVRSVQVVNPQGQSDPIYTNISVVSLVVSLDDTPDRTYERTDVVTQNPDLYDLAMRDTLARLKSSMDAVETLQRIAAGPNKRRHTKEIKRAHGLIGDAQNAISALQ